MPKSKSRKKKPPKRVLALRLDSIQQREDHWVIADLVGKGGHIRTVPIPTVRSV